MKRIEGVPVAIVQLPFPSQLDPLPILEEYYTLYEKEYAKVFPQYKIEPGALWEAPLWVAHLDGAIGREDSVFVDLSSKKADPKICTYAILNTVSDDHLIFVSPLSQNYDLAVSVSHALMELGYKTVIGGNMSGLATTDDFSVVYNGLARRGIYESIVSGQFLTIGESPRRGRQQIPLDYRPQYRLLSGYYGRISFVRLHASHGCLFDCSFCGDAWSHQLHIVPPSLLREEIQEIRACFPQVRLFYIGDKTFGQSKEAVQNLIECFESEGDFDFICQTHVKVVSDWLLESMQKLGIRVVELGMESGSEALLQHVNKRGSRDDFISTVEHKLWLLAGIHSRSSPGLGFPKINFVRRRSMFSW